MARSLRLTGSLASLLTLASCAGMELTEVVIETDTDYAPGTEIARVEWEVRSNRSEPFLPRPSVEIDEDFVDFPMTFTVVPAELPDSPLSVTARGYRTDGSLLVAQTRTTRFVPGASLVLRLDLARRCEGFPCDENQSCFAVNDNARCGSDAVDPELVPPHRPGRPSGMAELCNGRDDDGDGTVDEGFDFDVDTAHCGGCFAACQEIEDGNGTMVCEAGACGFRCNPRRGDCDGDPANGCEVRLDEASRCGACTEAACGPPTSLCTPTSDSAECVAICDASTTECSGACRDTQFDSQHCGGCGIECGDVGLGDSMCVEGECTVDCDMGAHACDGQCVSDADMDFCAGADRCSPCPTGAPNVASVACEERACVNTCEAGYFDCDGNPDNGCEVRPDLDDDPRNCGGCGVDCGYGTCAEGVCSTAVRSFAVGARHSCAVLADDTVWCWGANEHGQSSLNFGERTLPGPALVTRAKEGEVVSFSALDEQTSYLTVVQESGSVIVTRIDYWGRDPADEAGRMTTDLTRLVESRGEIPFDVGGGSGLMLYSALGTSDTLWGWGNRGFEAFSDYDGTGTGFTGPIDLTRHTGPDSEDGLSRGDRESCVVDGTMSAPQLMCWGIGKDTDPVYLGNGTVAGSLTPTRIDMEDQRFRDDASFDLGFAAGCAPFGETAVPSRYGCWGVWECGPEGLSPTFVEGVASAPSMPDISVGRSAACAAQLGSGNLICWGRDLLGVCHPEQHQPFPALEDVTRVQLGRDHGCFLRRVGGDAGSGSLFCWGSNAEGQLGVGRAGGLMGPTQVVFRTRPEGL
ncbi:MAG: hypothetical protein AB8I08_10460 [Sandaracinaceae bacterium]